MPKGEFEDQEEINRIGNASNRHQGSYKKVLCVCSGGLLRSPTAAVVLAHEPFNYNTRSCDITAEYALTKIDKTMCSSVGLTRLFAWSRSTERR